MDSKIQKLIDGLDIEKKFMEELNLCTLETIHVNRKTNIATFVIQSDKILSNKLYFLLDNHIKELYKNYYDDVVLRINPTSINFDLIPDYYKNTLEICKSIEVLSMNFIDNLELVDGKYVIEVSNKGELHQVDNMIDLINKLYKNYGFNCEISAYLNKEKDLDIKKIINESVIASSNIEFVKVEKKEESDTKYPKRSNASRPVAKKPDEGSILGRTIKDKPVQIHSLIGEEAEVTVEAYVFKIDTFESNKSEYKIITLSISDNTDSILCKIFCRDKEDYDRLCSSIKTGEWYYFRGYTKQDMYARELVLNARDIMVSSHDKQKRVDNSPVKRVELHAHTMMSQMDGVTKLDLAKHTCELVERCIDMGYSGVAITDHSGCQAFPISFGIIKKHNKKIRSKIKDEIAEVEEKLNSSEITDDEKKELESKYNELLKKKENPPIFKGLYGTELTLVDDTVDIVVRPTDDSLLDSTYVVFDTETTGFNASGGDQMIEIGAVKIKNGEIIDRFDELINPNRHIPDIISNLTQITDDMVKDARSEEEVTKSFIEWTKDLPMVAHNAKFDISFLTMAYKKYNLGEFTNTVIDTLELSRIIDQTFNKHSLSALVKRYDVPWDEDAHHRADYDAEGTALVFAKMIKKLDGQKCELISDLDKLVSRDEIYKFGRTYHFNAIAVNQQGLKNLFEIISLANTTYFYKGVRIPRSKLNELRDGILIGSGCYQSEVFENARSKDGEELSNIINFYDYVEVQPPEVYSHLIQMSDFKNRNELLEHIKKVIDSTKKAGKIIVATGDVHHFDREDKIYREIIVNQKVPGGGLHPLAKKDITDIPSQHFRTTEEMLEDFSFLDSDLAYEIVVENTNKILNMVEELEVIPDTGGTPFSPRIKSDDGSSYLDCPRVVTDLVYTRASSWYGDVLPHAIEERLGTELYGDILLTSIKDRLSGLPEDELVSKSFSELHNTILKGFDAVKDEVRAYLVKNNPDKDSSEIEKELKKSLGGIIGAGFDPIYLIAQRLVKHSNDEGYLVGSRGSVGSSFVATMMGITEVNPLSAHYRCDKCKLSIFEDDDGTSLGATYSTGFDLPDKECPNCHIPMIKDGQDMPFATFLGFNADKVPDIDLNFSDLNQASAHAYTKVLFGSDNVFRAGTIGTVADKTAFGFVKGYFEDRGITDIRNCEIERLALGCTGVKRTTGQHPGGIVVIPDYKNCFDFTPFQYPAEDPTSAWRTTHFDYHSIEECVLKLDILGHSDPTQLRIIGNQSGTDVMKVPMDDKDTMSIFTSTDTLGVKKEDILCNTGTLGIPEFGTPFTIKLVEDTKPTTFGELIKISGLSHGTDVWLGNAQDLILNNIVPFKEVIGCRDDIMVDLMYRGLPPIKAFKIMEFVRKGRASGKKNPDDPKTWEEYVELMREFKVEDWFIDSCAKIKYMFPKAHAAAYVISAFRIAWYKVHMPVYFYSSWFSCKATDVDIDAMIKGYSDIKSRILEIQEKGYDATNKEGGQLESLKLGLEATARGIKFLNIDLYKSKSNEWLAISDNEIIPPFSSIDGLGESVADNIVREREKGEFFSIEDFQKRCKVSKTLIDKMKDMGILGSLPESSQMTLF